MASSTKRVAVLGATRGMGRSLARQFSARGDAVALLGRELDELDRSAADLKTRTPNATVVTAVCDLERVDTFGPALERAEKELGGLDVVVVTAGVFGTQEQLEADLALTQRVLTVDFANTVVFCEVARAKLLARGGGTLCVFSSVAGDRPRKPVVLYGAAKAGLSAYLDGVDLRFRSKGLITVCVKPGFVKTGMTEGLKPPPFAGEPDAVATQVIAAVDAGKRIVYSPTIWWAVMTVIRSLPRFIMRRVGF
jgi:decaprenylphospho-beta-D-erythro-pentofuranosid-2-ulose 2-reductase